jgi:hypothetical protein
MLSAVKTSFAILVLMLASLAATAATLVAPQVLVCPGPLFPAKCSAPVYAPIGSALTAASFSKTVPQWAHTFGGYSATTPLVVCPVGATLSTDAKACTSASGSDASVLMPKSAIVAPSPPVNPTGPVATQSVVIASVDYPGETVSFGSVPVPACFTINAKQVCVP